MQDQGRFTFVIVNRKTYKGERFRKYLDYGWICKYFKSKAACIDFTLENRTPYVAVACNSRGTVVGVFKFEYNARWKKIIAFGTWVRPQERKLGIGSQLWNMVFDRLGVRNVTVKVVSDKGATLMESLERRFPNVEFCIEQAGERKLRLLGKNRAATYAMAA